MSYDDAAVTTASLSLIDPRPSCKGVQCITYDVYGWLAGAASARIPSAPMAAAAAFGRVILFIHGGGFAAGDKEQCVTRRNSLSIM